MKKIVLGAVNKLFVFGCLVFSFFVMGKTTIKAQSYDNTPGKVEEVYKGIIVNSFNYDYITTFDKESGYYNGNEVFDSGLSLSEKGFYSGRKVVINIKHHDSALGALRIDDDTIVYKYNFGATDFESVSMYDNENGSHELNEQGIYKIEYRVDSQVIHTNYIYINKNVLKIEVTPDSYYNNYDVYGVFKYNLVVEDVTDLEEFAVRVGFGQTKETVTFMEYSSTEITKNDTDEAANKINANLSHKITTQDVGDSNYFFVEFYIGTVSADNKAGEARTTQTLNVNKKMRADVYLVGEDGSYLEDKQYYSKTDTIKLLIKFRAPITYTGFKYFISNGIGDDIDDETETETTEVYITHTFAEVEQEIESEFKLNYTGLMHKGERLELDINSHFSFAYDGKKPVISVDGSNLEAVNSSVKGKVIVNIEDSNLDKVAYYFAKCIIVNLISGDCRDSFNDAHEAIVYSEHSNEITFNDIKEKYNEEEIWLFVRAIDLGGNFSENITTKIVMDNVIVPEDEIDNLFLEVDSYDEISESGKMLKVRIPDAYYVDRPWISFTGNSYTQCEQKVRDGKDYTVSYSTCLSTNDYIALNVKVKLYDKYDNEEEYEVWFRYSPVVPQTVNVDNRSFETFNDIEEYDALFELSMNNSILTNDVIFSETVISKVEEVLGIVSTAKKRLVYLDGEREIDIISTVEGSLSVPTMSNIIKKLSDIDKYRTCELKDNDCSIDLYLRYEYDLETEENLLQIRNVKIALKDNSNKYAIDNFNDNVFVEVNTQYENLIYKLYDCLNIEIMDTNVTKSKKITYTSSTGALEEVQSIDVTKLGVYNVVESFVYNNIESFPLSYMVTVRDSVAPVVTLKGKEKIIIKKGENFEDPSVQANDNYDSDLIIITSWDKELNVGKKGEYAVSYWAVDSSGNKSNVVTRVVVVEGNISVYITISCIVLGVILIISLGIMIEGKRKKRRA